MKKKYITIGTAILVLASALFIGYTSHDSSDISNPQVQMEHAITSSPDTDAAENSVAPTQEALKSFQDSFAISLPDGWDIRLDDSVYMATLTYHGENAGYFSFYTPWTTTTDGLVGILGTHAYADGEATDTDMGDFIRKKINVSFKLSAVESENGEKIPDSQIHYFYYYPALENKSFDEHSTLTGEDWVGDLYFDSSLVEETEMDTIANSLKLTCIDSIQKPAP